MPLVVGCCLSFSKYSLSLCSRPVSGDLEGYANATNTWDGFDSAASLCFGMCSLDKAAALTVSSFSDHLIIEEDNGNIAQYSVLYCVVAFTCISRDLNTKKKGLCGSYECAQTRRGGGMIIMQL